MNQNGMKFFEAIGRLPENLVTESESICGYYDHPVKEKRSRRPAWLTDGVIAAAVCVLVGIATYVGIIKFMSGGFDHLAALFGKDDTTAETTLDDSTSQDAEDITSDYAEDITTLDGEEIAEETTQAEDTEETTEETTRSVINSPEDVETMAYTEEELNSFSEKILHPENGETLRIDFGIYTVNSKRYLCYGGDSRYKDTDSFLGWIWVSYIKDDGTNGLRSIPVTVEFAPGILNDKTKMPDDGIVVLSEKGVELIDGRIIYHAVDIIYDICVFPNMEFYLVNNENGVIYGSMIDYWNSETLQVKFIPEHFEIPDAYIAPMYYFQFKNQSLCGIKKMPRDGDIVDLSGLGHGIFNYLEVYCRD